MKTRDALENVESVSHEILKHLRDSNRALDAATLIREYCKQNKVHSETAEIALSVLFNKGLVEMDREMQLKRRKAVEAA